MDLFHDLSIIIISLSDSIYLERCIRSCLAQTFPAGSFETILVAEKSQKNVVEIAGNYEGHITSVLNDSKLSFGQGIEQGLKRASGRYVIFVDVNDFISDYCLLFQTIFLYDNAYYQGVGVDYWLVEQNSDRRVERIAAFDQPLFYGVMYRKEVFLKEGVYEHNLKEINDGVLRDLLKKHIQIGHLPISFYRRQKKDE